MKVETIKIEKRKISDLIRAEYNPRKITKVQIQELKEGIEEFGLVSPIVVNELKERYNVIIGGHQRLKILEDLGYTEVDCSIVSLPLDKERKLNIKLNKNGGSFDDDLLKEYFDYEELTEWGFTPDELFDKEETTADGLIDDDEIPEAKESRVVLGDIWKLGKHRIMCGDSTSSDDVAKLMNGEKADMVFTDPPYGVAIKNTKGSILGDQNLEVFFESLSNIELFSKEDSHIYIYFGIQYITECALKIKEYFKQTNILIQKITHENKPSPNGYFKNNYEVCYFSNKGKKGFNSGILEVSESTKNDSRYNGDGFLNTYLALNEIKSTEHNAKSIHPTQKTIEICSFYQKVSSNINDLILDLFLGSGSTLISAEKLNRKCYGMELDEKYCDVIIERWEQFTGLKAEKLNE